MSLLLSEASIILEVEHLKTCEGTHHSKGDIYDLFTSCQCVCVFNSLLRAIMGLLNFFSALIFPLTCLPTPHNHGGRCLQTCGLNIVLCALPDGVDCVIREKADNETKSVRL